MAEAVRDSQRRSGRYDTPRLPASGGDIQQGIGSSVSRLPGTRTPKNTGRAAPVKRPLTHLMAGVAVPIAPAITKRFGGIEKPVDLTLLQQAEGHANLLTEMVE